jgi:hypothetical protein
MFGLQNELLRDWREQLPGPPAASEGQEGQA